ncbi:MAG: hypothetical protein WBN60_02935, partial [Polyangiales bacterium]
MKISRWTFGIALAAVVSLWGLVEATASPFSMYLLADDLGNRVNGSAPEQSEWDTDGDYSETEPGGGSSGSTDGPGAADSDGDSGGGTSSGGNPGGDGDS